MANQDTDLRCYLTNAGIAAENNSIQLGRKLPVKEMVFGSGLLADGSDPRLQTTMIQEEYAVPCGMLFDPESPTLLVFKSDLPADVGGFHIHEVAIRLEDGTLYGYARGKGDYKPTIEQGATDSVRYAVEMYTTNASNVECKVDLSKVYVDWEDLEVAMKKAEDDLSAHAGAPNPHPQYAMSANTQFLPYDPTRIYSVGEVCYTKAANGKVTYWEWYSNVESLAGKDPLNTANRRIGWANVTKPFYWKPYMPKVAGETMSWDTDTIPENMVVGIGQQLPKAVYHSLATAKPEWIDATDNSLINIPDRQGRFVRAADGTTWLVGQTHEDAIRNITGSVRSFYGSNVVSAGAMREEIYGNSPAKVGVIGGDPGANYTIGFDASRVVPTAAENQPKAFIEWVGYAL
ncbi:tail fiber protein [Vibrio phage Va_90-11-286_p16]|jgi:hypothetical protein|nr:tail fiber protein [Vibrio phage Va_90-11-286_p16]